MHARPHVYRAFGVELSVDFLCPDAAPSAGPPDARITFGTIPDHLSSASAVGPMLQAAPNEILLCVDGIARYWIHSGNQIVIDPVAAASQDDVRAYLFTGAMTILLHQRRVVPVHASAVATAHSSVLFAGHSGAGKSTLAAGLIAKGYRLVTDDVAPLTFRGGQLVVSPGLARFKLWGDAVNDLGLNPSDLDRVRPTVNRYHLPVAAHQMVGDAQPVKAVYVLQRRKDADSVVIEPLAGNERFSALRTHIHSQLAAAAAWAPIDYFDVTTSMADAVPWYRVVRPAASRSVAELVDEIDERLQG